jgi:hypothetical protein
VITAQLAGAGRHAIRLDLVQLGHSLSATRAEAHLVRGRGGVRARARVRVRVRVVSRVRVRVRVIRANQG